MEDILVQVEPSYKLGTKSYVLGELTKLIEIGKVMRKSVLEMNRRKLLIKN